MALLNDFKRDLKVVCARAGISKREMAKAAGKSECYLCNFVKNKEIVSPILVQLCDAVGYDVIVEYIKREEYLKETDYVPELPEAAEAEEIE